MMMMMMTATVRPTGSETPSDVFSGCSVVTLEVSEGEKADWTTAETGQRVKFGLDVVLI